MMLLESRVVILLQQPRLVRFISTNSCKSGCKFSIVQLISKKGISKKRSWKESLDLILAYTDQCTAMQQN
jgi:hypothetical protein